MEKKRLGYLDTAKGIGIILVVAGHSGLVSENALTWLASFHMPLFFIISGMLLCHKKEEEKDYRASLKKKARVMLLPYLYFSLIYIAIDIAYIIRRPELFSWDIVGNAALETASFYGISVLWFLPVLFFAEAVFLLLRKKTGHVLTFAVCAVSAAVCIMAKKLLLPLFPADAGLLAAWTAYALQALLRIGPAVLFLAFGYGTYALLYQKNLSKLTFAIAAIIWGAVNLCLAFFNGRVDLHFLVFGNVFIYFLAAYAGSMAVLSLCKAMPEWKGLSFLGENSLAIMVTHLDCQVMICAIRAGMFVSSRVPRAKTYVYKGTTALALLVAEVVLVLVINRFFPFLLGKKKNA